MTGSTMVLKLAYGKLNGYEDLAREAFQPLKLEADAGDTHQG